MILRYFLGTLHKLKISDKPWYGIAREHTYVRDHTKMAMGQNMSDLEVCEMVNKFTHTLFRFGLKPYREFNSRTFMRFVREHRLT